MSESVVTFGDVVDAHQIEILRYLCRLTGDPDEAEDLFQETFLRAFRAFGRLRRASNHRAWLFRIATNVFLNHRRHQRRRPEIPLADDVASAEPSPARRHRAGVTMAAYRRAIESLPPRQRVAFVQRRLQGWSYAQVAVAMGSSPATARANVYQAVRRLRRELSDHR